MFFVAINSSHGNCLGETTRLAPLAAPSAWVLFGNPQRTILKDRGRADERGWTRFCHRRTQRSQVLSFVNVAVLVFKQRVRSDLSPSIFYLYSRRTADLSERRLYIGKKWAGGIFDSPLNGAKNRTRSSETIQIRAFRPTFTRTRSDLSPSIFYLYSRRIADLSERRLYIGETCLVKNGSA